MPNIYPLHGGTVDQLRRQLADAKRAEQATAQLLDEARAELSRTRPMADAGHAYCAARKVWLDSDGVTGFEEVERAREAFIAAHMATTPSPGPATHAVVSVEELERLRGIEDAVRVLAHVPPDEAPERWHNVLVLLGEDTP